ncbi:enoyl-CoA hydratase/isomerase family protein [Wenxinia marina]|uniref:3-hydroxyisobutyryl-CoA hydrolase n=1 Tax=Wenxinia marina DSM 24838 TaxID=1123501 RepID=A0A0D0QHN6_9RHOB|nr:enoyl-CoA hydratase/isomerase family protein [Wenxinia marina]KIQ70593.1 Enoyl-CoA hydratase/carnithine racemase [Wenxinia marina DSM 24838]GGL51871.1 enoyl-CoA hydratase [Wenxinia marina]
MSDVAIRTEGRAGRITLTRPKALNALTLEMVHAIDAALVAWADDPEVALVLIDGEGDKAFCAGGDIREMYRTGTRGDFSYGRTYWRDEYRMNARLAHYPKPVIAFLQGFTMGGGVGLGCHASHRIVGGSSRIAMPECSIGLVPDVGGSLLLARAPGRLGEYLGTTGDRMDAGDAIFAGFADQYLPESGWEALKQRLVHTGDAGEAEAAAHEAPDSRLAAHRAEIDEAWHGSTLAEIMDGLPEEPSEAVQAGVDLMARNAPLSMAVTVEMIHAVRESDTIEAALEHEYRVTHRAMEHGDFLEGIRAQVIDKDRVPRWRHADWRAVTEEDVRRMTAPLGADALRLEGNRA